jgi:ADP-heptose:LPS heptosyltransferase
MKTDSADFFSRTRDAKKIMVLDLGFLGDTVHLLPSLWMARTSYPDAELHVTVASHITSFMSCAPWVDRVWGYMRYPRHATVRENFNMVRRLRREKFDVLINLNGSDRSSWLTFFSGAPERLGRVPNGGGPPLWKRMFTAYVDYPFGSEPIYLQRCRCLEKAGFPYSQPEFHVEISPENLRPADISESEKGSYFHISPFTTADYKELAPEQVAGLIAVLGQHFPGKKIALSCAPTDRELAKMEKLMSLLPRKPWRVFAGNLNLIQIAAVIKYSALHFCGDTGTFHLAVMTQTPVVGWFWPNPGVREWIPEDQKCQVIVGANPPGATFLANVSTDALVDAAKSAVTAV